MPEPVQEAASAGVDAIEIAAIARIDARLTGWDWPFARDFRAEIDAHWLQLAGGRPALFNGKVILQHRMCRSLREDGRTTVEAEYFVADYASFIARKIIPHRADGVRNGFGMAALRSADGAWLLGHMAEHTFKAGQVYFAAGTPDLSDVRPDGHVDLKASVLRELEEETGLSAAEVELGSGWEAVTGRHEIAYMRPMRIGMAAEDARALMLSRIARQIQPELADIVIIRSAADFDERMPRFMQAYLLHAFAKTNLDE